MTTLAILKKTWRKRGGLNSQALSDACLANKCGYHFTTLPFCLAVATGYDPAFSPVTGEYHYQASPATINLEEDNGVEPSPYHYNGPGFKSGCLPRSPIFQMLLYTFPPFLVLSCMYFVSLSPSKESTTLYHLRLK